MLRISKKRKVEVVSERHGRDAFFTIYVDGCEIGNVSRDYFRDTDEYAWNFGPLPRERKVEKSIMEYDGPGFVTSIPQVKKIIKKIMEDLPQDELDYYHDLCDLRMVGDPRNFSRRDPDDTRTVVDKIRDRRR